MVIKQEDWVFSFRIMENVRHEINNLYPILQYRRREIKIHSEGLKIKHKDYSILHSVADRRFAIWWRLQ